MFVDSFSIYNFLLYQSQLVISYKMLKIVSYSELYKFLKNVKLKYDIKCI